MTTVELPIHATALVGPYDEAVARIHELDLEMGDTAAKGNAFFNDVKERNPDAVAEAETFIQQVKDMADAEFQAVVAYIVSRDRELSRLATDFIKANEPEVATPTQSNEVLAHLWEERSKAQKLAASLFEAIRLTVGVEADVLNTMITPLPAGKRGAAPGTKRGKMGRKLPAGIHWTVAGEEVGEKDTKTVASLVGVKVAELRTHLEAEFPDSLPQVFETTINEKVVRGVIGEPTTPAVEDDTDDLDFDDED